MPDPGAQVEYSLCDLGKITPAPDRKCQENCLMIDGGILEYYDSETGLINCGFPKINSELALCAYQSDFGLLW